MANAHSSRKRGVILALRAAAIIVSMLGGPVVAAADTLIMPKRDGLRNESLVLWGITTLPNHLTSNITTTYRFLVNNGAATTPVASGNVTGATERSYINATHTFASAGSYIVTLEVTRGNNPPESASVEVQIFDPANMGPGTKTLPVGPGSNEQYRNLRINMAIQDGLRYLWVNQNGRTNFATAMASWGPSTHAPQWTAFVVTAFENHGYRLPNDASVPPGLYERYVVQRGLDFVVANLEERAIGTGVSGQPAERNACVGVTTDVCVGLTDTNPSTDQGYTVGIAMMPLAASSALDRQNGNIGPTVARNKTYKEILQRLSNTLAWGQLDGVGSSRGGWGYSLNAGIQDGSVMGWAILGLLDAQAVNIEVPDWVEDELVHSITSGLNHCLPVPPNPLPNPNCNGSWDYNPNGPTIQGSFTGMPKGGIPLQGMFYTGEVSGGRVELVKRYISDRWNAATRVLPDTQTNPCGIHQNFGCAYSMFNNFKGLQLQNVPTLPGVNRAAGPGAIVANDWLASYEDWLVNNQGQGPTGGSWPMRFSPHSTADTFGNSAIAELILSGVALVLPDADRFATVGLSVDFSSLVEGGTVTLTAHAQSTGGAPVPGATVNFTIISGLNAGLFSGSDVTDANGLATFQYTDPGPLGTFGTDTVRANIGALLSNPVNVVWEPFNRPPVANADSFTVDEDGESNGNVIANDTDPDNDDLTAAVVSNVTHGQLALNINGSFSYRPGPNFCGTDGFTYDLNDGLVDSNVATVSITIVCVNDAPAADDSSGSTAEDTPLTGVVSSSDIDGGAPQYTISTPPAHGDVALNQTTGAFTYTPDVNYHGSDSFTFSVSDNNGGADTGNVSITVTPVNDDPVPNDSSDTTAEDTPGDGSVGASDVDTGDTLTYAVTDPPDHGTLVLDPNTGDYVYTPNPDYNGGDSFSFSVSDGTVTIPGGDVSLTVTAVNDAPVPNDSSDTTAEDTPGDGSVGASDVDGDPLTYVVTDPPDHGTLVLDPNTGGYVYTPHPDYNGGDSFSFSVSDGTVTIPGGDVTLTVIAVNDLPICTTASPSIASLWPPDHSLIDVNVLGVSDPVEGSAITISITSIWQDEPTNTIGDGNTLIDGFGVGTPIARVRRERSGSKRVPGDGRMYYINFTGTDAEGGECTGTVQVGVPHDLGKDHQIGAGGPIHSSTGQQ